MLNELPVKDIFTFRVINFKIKLKKLLNCKPLDKFSELVLDCNHFVFDKNLALEIFSHKDRIFDQYKFDMQTDSLPELIQTKNK